MSETAAWFTVATVEESYRAASEDRLAVLPLTQGKGGVVLAIADGVGGRPGGAAAAEQAVVMLEEAVAEAEAGASFLRPEPVAWYRLVKTIDAALADNEAAGETTFVIVHVTPRKIVGVSVGDSEAWLVTPDGHFDLTGGQKRKPYLGHGMAEPVPFALPNPGRGTLIVASDGLFKYAPSERILEAVLHPDLETAAQRTLQEARLPNGTLPDDAAIILCHLHEEAGRKSLGEKILSALKGRRSR